MHSGESVTQRYSYLHQDMSYYRKRAVLFVTRRLIVNVFNIFRQLTELLE